VLDEQTRATILELHERGWGKRKIARSLRLSRNAVRTVIASCSAEMPALDRREKAECHHEEILELHASCKGNLVRVHEELRVLGARYSYQALTAYCRRHGIGYEPPEPAGSYTFHMAEEMQHDTSPHKSEIGGVEKNVQIASLVLCFSRLTFIQLYPRFTRFECKVFLDDALDYVGGACDYCMIDNTSVIVLRGTGADMVPAPEMAAFGDQRRFKFRAHEKGDANRSARVELSFDYVQNNFLVGRHFSDWNDVNRQAVEWCDKINATFSRKLHASRRELFASEKPRLKPLPDWRSPVYRLHQRVIDLEGYVNVHGFRYSVPSSLIGRRVEVRETRSDLLVFEGPRLVATHERRHEGPNRICLPEHRRDQHKKRRQIRMQADERELRARLPGFESYLTELIKRAPRGRAIANPRRLRRMLRDYPREPLLEALKDGSTYGLYDLERIETVILRNIRGDFFPRIATESDDDDER